MQQQYFKWMLIASFACLGGCKSKSEAPPIEKQAAKGDVATVAFFENALETVQAGKVPDPADTKPYGCGVKYAESAANQAAEATLGELAPDFELLDLEGNSVKLSQFLGKTVVLEWYNPQCPFVEHAYTQGPLAGLAAKQAEKVVWLNINSGAPGKQGAGKELNQASASTFQIKHPVLLDESGIVGKKYGAKTTPQMYIVDAKGLLVYRGGLDNAPFGKVEG